MPMRFEIPDHKLPELQAWREEQDRIAKEKLAAEAGEESECGYPLSATGESVVYEFMPTSLGPCIKARHLYTKSEIDLSDEI